jgi:hypothetical protein
MIFLADLPPEHPDRNRPLLGCNFKLHVSKVWKYVMPNYAIQDNNYNELADVWTHQTDWTWETPS